MKKIIYVLGSAIIVILMAILGMSQTASAHAGITPESTWYFLDISSEGLREFFTTNPEGKAKLQITFAAERIEEIRAILEAKGVEAKGLGVAQARLQEHLAKAAAIVSEQKIEGWNTKVLAQELNNGLEGPKSSLTQIFNEQKRALETKEKELNAQLKTVQQTGDVPKQDAIAQELGQVKAKLELLELKEEEIKEDIEDEEERLEEEMEAKVSAEKIIQEAEKELVEIKSGAAAENIELPASAFAEFNNLLSQAKVAFQSGNYEEAKRLAKKTEDSLEKIENTVEELEKQQEQENKESEG